MNPLIVDTKGGDIIVDFPLAIPGYEENIVTRALQAEIDGKGSGFAPLRTGSFKKRSPIARATGRTLKAFCSSSTEGLTWSTLKNWLTQFAEILDGPDILDRYHGI